MRAAARAGFVAAFGAEPELVAWAPGRVNLIGEHTDYNDGFVLPLALDVGTVVAGRARTDRVLRTVAVRFGETSQGAITALVPEGDSSWRGYVDGCAAVLLRAGHTVTGADLLIDGDLPLGSGLSSSASLEIAVLIALSRLSGLQLAPATLARLGQQVENEYIGVRCGVMDQLVIAAAQDGNALLIDCRDLSTQDVPLPPHVRVLVLDSGIPRTLASSAYNLRRSQCESALAKLQRAGHDLGSLRDVTPELLEASAPRLTADAHRRVRHVVSENERVLAAAQALRSSDFLEVGRLMNASHVSLRNDYDVSGPELDVIVRAAQGTPGVFGAKLTGAGFGGCVVALVEADLGLAAAATVLETYERATGRAGTFHVSDAHAGARVLEDMRLDGHESEPVRPRPAGPPRPSG